MSKELKTSRGFVGILLAMAWMSTSGWTQAMLSGTVVDEHGKPVKGALVSIDQLQTNRHFEVTTNKKGYYIHGGLPLGFYKIILTIDGEMKARWLEFRISPGYNKLDFDLAEIARTSERVITPEEREALEKQKARVQAAQKKFSSLKQAFSEGRELFAAKQYDQAVIACSRAAEIDATQHLVFGNLAASYEKVRKHEEAIENYRRALALLNEKPDPEGAAKYHMNLGIIYGQRGEADLAVEQVTKAAELNPELASEAFYNLGAMLTNSGDVAGASKAFRQALEADPKNANAHYQLGLTLVGLASVTTEGKTIPAPGTIEAFENYLKFDPDGRFAASAKSMIAMLSKSIQAD